MVVGRIKKKKKASAYLELGFLADESDLGNST
jgi:hypothetical protein